MKKLSVKNIFVSILCTIIICANVFAVSIDNTDLSGGDPYYNIWNKNFIFYVDNYKGDVNNVSIDDLNAGNGTSCVYFFSKLGNDKYTYDTLFADVKNNNMSTNLHDAKPILIHLPKTAKNWESHALLKSNDEKGKLFSGGPYSKYSTYENGFYYKDKKMDKKEVEELLKDYSKKVEAIDKRISKLKTFSFRDLYPTAKLVYMTNGATATPGTYNAVVYTLDLDYKFSPFYISTMELRNISTNSVKGAATKDLVPNWDVNTIYIFSDDGKTLIESIPFPDFKQKLWDKQ